MTDASQDPVVRQLRDQISDNDRAIVEAVNKRLKLVARLQDYKASHGFEAVDPVRESWMVSYLTRANRGPLSSEGLHELHSALLDLTKRELAIEAEAKTKTP